MNKRVALVVVIVTLAILVRIFLIDSFVVKGDSMAPAVLPGDYVFIDKLSYRFTDPKRGDVVVAQVDAATNTKVIKRVLGLPGEYIRITDSAVTVRPDRKAKEIILSEPYLSLHYNPKVGIDDINIDPQEYFLLGDNRAVSIDSRALGAVSKWNIEGRVFFIIGFKHFRLKVF